MEDGRLKEGNSLNTTQIASQVKLEEGSSSTTDKSADGEDGQQPVDAVTADPSPNIANQTSNITDDAVDVSKRQGGDWTIYKFYSKASLYHWVIVYLIGQSLGSFFSDFPGEKSKLPIICMRKTNPT